MRKPLGYVIQESTSPIDGAKIVVILTTGSRNRKTGDMCQVWILRADVSPVQAVNTGEDYSICGDCPHRKQADGSRSCYVNVGQAPNTVWKAYQAGKYERDLHVLGAREAVAGRKIRFGAYGDPALIKPLIFRILTNAAEGHTAYTHQWKEPWAQWTAGYMQASCDGMADYLEASSRGFKTFAVIPKNGDSYSGKLCPATVEGSKVTCLTCSLCDGVKADIFVEAHGSGAKYVAA
tara:strand:+ start:604 stop:1308 length:705 start_codon:yes stop_codon:yes gene_type:complete